MFAVVRTGGKQYRVAPGDKIVVEKLDGNAGDRITLGDILLAGDGADLKKTEGLTVAAEIVAQAKADKVTVFKKRRRQNYRRKKGHRQQHTILKIVAIGDHKAEKKPAAKAEVKAEAPKTEAKAATPAKAKAADAPKADVLPTENPAPDAKAKKAPSAKKPVPSKAGGSASDAKLAKAASTKNAAPAKGAKKAPKAK